MADQPKTECPQYTVTVKGTESDRAGLSLCPIGQWDLTSLDGQCAFVGKLLLSLTPRFMAWRTALRLVGGQNVDGRNSVETVKADG